MTSNASLDRSHGMGPGYLPPLVLTPSDGHQNMVDNRAVPTGMMSCLLISFQG